MNEYNDKLSLMDSNTPPRSDIQLLANNSGYDFTGWSLSESDNTPDENALTNITQDRVVYACWKESKYSITTINGNETLGTFTVSSIDELSIPVRIINGTSQSFAGWSLENRNSPTPNISLSNGLILYACFKDEDLITDTWAEIHANTTNGTYKSKYAIGKYKLVDFGETYGKNVPIEIVAFDTDTKATGGTAPITWICKDTLKGTYAWNASNQEQEDYSVSDLKKTMTELEKSIKGDDIPTPYIVSVVKTFRKGLTCGGSIGNECFTLWVPSLKEIGGELDTSDRAKESLEVTDIYYSERFTNDFSFLGSLSRRKKETETTSNVIWWLRTADCTRAKIIWDVTSDGNFNTRGISSILRVAPGFCTT